MNHEEIKKTLQGKFKKINDDMRKKTGNDDDFVVQVSSNPEKFIPTYFPTTIPELDAVLGGGIPEKTSTVIYGTESAGKTQLAMMLTAEKTKQKKFCLWLLTEPPFPWEAAELHGVDKDYLYVVEPEDYGEQIIDVVDKIMYDEKRRKASGLIDLLVVDSINNLVGKKEIDKLEKDGAEGNNMAVSAGIWTNFLRRLQGRGMLRKGAICILIAQLRAKLDNPPSGGPPTQLSGGYAIRFNPKVHIKLGRRNISSRVDGVEKVVGHVVPFEVTKNNVYGKIGKGEFTVLHGIGIDDSLGVFQKAQDWGYIIPDKEAGRSFYRIILNDSDVIIKGLPNVRDELKVNFNLKNELKEILNKGKPKTPPIPNEKIRGKEESMKLPEGVEPFNVDELKEMMQEHPFPNDEVDSGEVQNMLENLNKKLGE